MKAHILVIEDEAAINDLICMNLEVAGYETTACLDGNEASELLAKDTTLTVRWSNLPYQQGLALVQENVLNLKI